MDSLKKNQYLTLFKCCICIGCSIGLISNCIGIYYTPLSRALGTGRGEIAAISTIISLSAALFAKVVAALIKRYPINLVMGGGVIVTSLGYLALSFAGRLSMLYIVAFFIGAGSIFFKNITVSIILRSWFGDKSASKLGLCMAVTGAVGAVMNPVFSSIITRYGYQTSFRTESALILLLALPAALTLRMNPDEETKIQGAKKASGSGETLPKATYLLILLMPVFMAGTTGMNTHFSSLAVSLGYSLTFSATVVSFQSIFNSLWKLVLGFMAEKIGPAKSGAVFIGINMTGIIILLTLSSKPAFLILGVCLYATAFSLATVCLPLIVQMFTKEHFADVFATANMMQTLCYSLYTTVYGKLSDMSAGYTPCLLFAICLSIGCGTVFLLAQRKYDAQKRS